MHTVLVYKHIIRLANARSLNYFLLSVNLGIINEIMTLTFFVDYSEMLLKSPFLVIARIVAKHSASKDSAPRAPITIEIILFFLIPALD